MRKQIAFLLAENTKMNARSTEIRKQMVEMRKQIAFLLAEITEMRKQTGKMSKQIATLLIQSVVKDKRSPV
ncbi:MAG: hypothetical protein H7Z11_20075 [Verrucomicrobia bacterium]|nr:hypothetical protein [Leptolyngbya sp. ES-bin-22]